MRVLLVLALSACGRISFDPHGGGAATAPDGPGAADPDGPRTGDGSTAAACAPWTAATRFTTTVRVAELASTSMEAQPRLSSDGLTIYFSSLRAGWDIYLADRSARDQPFTNVRLLGPVNSTASDVAFAPSEDQLSAYLSSARGGNSDLWISQRAIVSAAWGTPVRLATSTAFIDYDPSLSRDGLTLYFVIEQWDQGVGATDLVVATRASVTDTFGPPSLLAGLSGPGDDDNPSETADGRMLVFSSDRSDAKDIYFATRATTGDAYGTPIVVPDVNRPAVEDSEPFVTADGCELWFSSDRGGNYDIYFAQVIGS